MCLPMAPWKLATVVSVPISQALATNLTTIDII